MREYSYAHPIDISKFVISLYLILVQSIPCHSVILVIEIAMYSIDTAISDIAIAQCPD